MEPSDVLAQEMLEDLGARLESMGDCAPEKREIIKAVAVVAMSIMEAGEVTSVTVGDKEISVTNL